MPVDLEKLNLERPDPNYKADPALRGDNLSAGDDVEEEEDALEEEEGAPEKKPAKAPAKKEADEDDEDVEEEPEEEEEDPEEEEPEEPRKGKPTLKDRFLKVNAAKNEALERLAALEKENEQLRASKTPEQNEQLTKIQDRIETLYEEIEKARATGEYKEAATLQKELDGLRGRLTRAETMMLTRKAAVQEQQITVFNATLSQLETLFPNLSDTSPDFDQELLLALDETIRGYEALGETAPDALRKASRRLLRYDPFAKGDKAWLDGPPKGKAEDRVDGKATKPEKKKTDIKRNIDAAGRQPADPLDSTNDVPAKLDINKIKPEEFAKLPEAVRRRMRGDTLTRD